MIEYREYERLIVSFAFGLGIVLAAVASHISSSVSARFRWLLVGSLALIFLGLLDFAGRSLEPILFAESLFAYVAPALLRFGIPVWCNFYKRRLPRLFGTSLHVGLGIVVFGIALRNYQREEDSAIDRDTSGMAPAQWQPQRIFHGHFAKTDRGRLLRLEQIQTSTAGELTEKERRVLMSFKFRESIIRRAPATDLSNCHGWVFTGGKYWVAGGDVERILEDNGYERVGEPQPEDLVVYRENGNVVHTSIVRYVTPGQPVLVEGKWSWMGVFMHPVDESIYGKGFEYYRSSRRHHVMTCYDDPTQAH